MQEGPAEIAKPKRVRRIPKTGIRADGQIDNRHKVTDWNLAYDQFLLVYKPKGMTQQTYALTILKIDEAWVSTNFSRIKTDRILTGAKGKMANLLAVSLSNVKAGLAEQADYSDAAHRTGISPEFKSKYGLEAFKAMADRLGFSPQAINLSVTQNNQTSVVIPPIFASQYADDAKKMLEG